MIDRIGIGKMGAYARVHLAQWATGGDWIPAADPRAHT